MADYPSEITVTLSDLMKMETYAHVAKTKHRVHSILAGQHASKLRGRGLDFAEVRDYVAGDDIRSIDWLVTARTGKTHTKVFNEEKERPCFAIVDQSSFMFFGSRRYTKSVIAAHFAAMAGFHTIKSGDRFGGIVFGDESFDHVVPRRSSASVQTFLQCLVKRNRELPLRKNVRSNRSMLIENLHRAAGMITHDYVVAIISDFSDIDDELKNQFTRMSRHNDVILVHVTDPMDEKMPDGVVVLSDGEHQLLWQNNRKDAGRKYAQRFEDVHDKFPRQMLRYNVPVVVLDTLQPLNEQVVKILGKALRP